MERNSFFPALSLAIFFARAPLSEHPEQARLKPPIGHFQTTLVFKILFRPRIEKTVVSLPQATRQLFDMQIDVALSLEK